jgi:hypothetical protein
MKITLIQEEIEEAITDYVLARTQIKDGMELSIDLSATRGTSGFTASIDIVPKAEPTPLNIARRATAAKKAATAQAAPTPVATTVAKAAAPAPEPTPEPTPEPAQEVEQEVEVAPAPEAVEDVADATQVEPAPAPKTSLFGNLNKPVNEKPAEA